MKPKIIVFDIETAPALAWVWGMWEQNVIEVERDPFMLSFAYQWLGGKAEVVALCDFKNYKKDPLNDKELIQKLRDLLDEADIVLGQNSDKFDIKWFNTRCVIHKIPPPSSFKTIDTLKLSKKYFSFMSNKLDFVSKRLGHHGKVNVGWSVWKGCLNGDAGAWRKMKFYNKRDVVETAKVYREYLPWINRINPVWDRTPCPACKSTNTQRRGESVTSKGKCQRFQCRECAKWFHGAKIIGRV